MQVRPIDDGEKGYRIIRIQMWYVKGLREVIGTRSWRFIQDTGD